MPSELSLVLFRASRNFCRFQGIRACLVLLLLCAFFVWKQSYKFPRFTWFLYECSSFWTEVLSFWHATCQRQSVFRLKSSFCSVLFGKISCIQDSRKVRFPVAFFFLFCLGVQPFSMSFAVQKRLFHILDSQPFNFPPTFSIAIVSDDDG